MNTKSTPQSVLHDLAQIQQMERGTLSVIRQGPTGPYYNHQCYEKGRNVSRYVPAEQVSALQEEAHQRIGRFEEGGAHQHFQLLHGNPGRFPRLEAGHQLLDFLVLGQEEFWRRVFFFAPASLWARVFSTTSCAYCCASSWKRW